MVIFDAPLTNDAYGYPRGAERRVKPIALTCLHITANPSTPPATAMEERNYANRVDSGGPSAHDYVDRNGDRVRAIDPVRYAAWTNGAVRSPKTGVPGVQAVLDLVARGFNANEAYHRTIEHCGRYAAYPITPEQVESTARQIALDSISTGISISRATVHLHSDIDSELRANCPVPAASAETWVAAVIARAQEIHQQETQMTWEELLAELDAKYQAEKTRADLAEAQVLALKDENTRLWGAVNTMTGLGREIVLTGEGA